MAGVGLILIAAALLWLLPSAETIGGADLLKWVGRAGLASTLGWAGSFAGPLALFAVAALLSIGAIYWRQLGAQPALIFLSAQPWLAVLALVVPVGVWLYLLLILVVNLVFWAVWIAVFTIVSVAGLAGAFRLLGALAQ